MKDIKGLVDKETLEKAIENNKDPYGKACVDVAINVMHYIDDFNEEFNIGYSPDLTTPHGIICKCDNQDGIKGFMASILTRMVAICYKDGWKFYIANALNPSNMDDDDRADKIVNNVVKAKTNR